MLERYRNHGPIPKTDHNVRARRLLREMSRSRLEFLFAHRLCHHARRRNRLEGSYQDAFALALSTVRRLRRPILETYYGLSVHASTPHRLFTQAATVAPPPLRRRRRRLSPRA